MPKLTKIIKKILGGLFVVGASSFLVSGTVGIVGEAHAQVDPPATSNSNNALGVDKTEVVGIVDLTLKVIYILLWPLLVIAGLSLDNSMVYGSFLHMDAPLWAFWNIMKNFANFALGFLVLFAIIRKIFSFGSAGDKREPQKIITQTLIAGVLIQISWFVMAALVDLSTVATYAVGALPLNIVSSTDLGKHKIMNAHVELDLSKFQEVVNGNEYYKIWYSVPYKVGNKVEQLNFSECKTQNGYIVGRMDGGTGFRNEVAGWGGTKNACVHGGQLVFFNEFPNAYATTTNAEYQAAIENVLKLGFEEDRESCNFIINIHGKTPDLGPCGEYFQSNIPTYITTNINTDWPTTSNPDYDWLTIFVPADAALGNYGLKEGDTRLQNNPAALSLDGIVDRSKGFVGPLITMYSSILDFAQLANVSNDTSFGEIGGEMLIKTGFAIGLFFPLVALAVVLIIRIGFMWVVIVLSPFLVLVESFGFAESLGESMKKHFNIANIIKVIFAPVVTVFALSISIVFMSVLMASIKTGGPTPWGMHLSNDAGGQLFSFFKDCLELKLDGFEFGGALDVFSWFLLNMVGIGLMRGIVFAAIKANSIGEAIGGQIQTFGSNFFQTLPILPMPGGAEPVGLRSFTNVVGSIPEKKISIMENQQRGRVEKRVGLDEGLGGTGSTGLSTTQINTLTTQLGGGVTKEVAATSAGTTVTEAANTANAPAYFDAIANMPGTPEAKAKAITGFGEILGNTNWDKEEKFKKDIKGKTLAETTAIITATAATDLKDLVGHKELLKDETGNEKEYTLRETAPGSNTYTFTPPAQ